MITPKSHRLSILLATAVLFLAVTGPASAFTQSGFGIGIAMGVPMGHEWVTRLAGIELLGYAQVKPDIPDPKDPRSKWTGGLAKNTDLSSAGAQAEVQRLKALSFNDERYASRYKAVYDVIIGERWVDIGGYNALTSRSCWDAVAQEPIEVQYDHFMRQYDDIDGPGGVNAARKSGERFIKYFVDAAMAPATDMQVYDGGVTNSTSVGVDRNYFLLGRAAHLLQDSFSSEHTVRDASDNFTKVRQVKSYMCAPGSEVHTRSKMDVIDYTSGDVIWRKGTGLDSTWNAYKPSNMTTLSLVATEASKDLWAAFIRTMGTPVAQREQVARSEATAIVKNWMSFDEKEMLTWYDDPARRDATYVLGTGQSKPGRTVRACMVSLKVKTDDQMKYAAKLRETQRKCLFNAVPWTGYSDLADPSMSIWYAWRWKNGPAADMSNPPAGWRVPSLPADTGWRVRIKSVASGQYMSAPDGLRPDAPVFCRAGAAPLDFIVVGSQGDQAIRATKASRLFLSYALQTGAVKLHDPSAIPPPTDPTNYVIAPSWSAFSIMSVYWKQYVWLSGETPFITSKGDPQNAHSQWRMENQR